MESSGKPHQLIIKPQLERMCKGRRKPWNPTYILNLILTMLGMREHASFRCQQHCNMREEGSC